MNKFDFHFDKTLQRRAWAIIDGVFGSHGLTLKRGYDFDVVEEMAKASGMKSLEGHFSPALNTYTPAQAFWLALLDQDGEMVGRVCARLDIIDNGMCLTDFWRKYFHRCYPNVEGGKVSLHADQPRVGRRISGRTAYFGGCEVRKDWRAHRLGGMLTQMVQVDAFDTWSADYYYGWVQGHNFMDGFWRDCGFTRAVFEGLRWEQPLPGTLDANLIFVGNSADDIADLIELTVRKNAVQLSGKTDVQTQRLSGTSE